MRRRFAVLLGVVLLSGILPAAAAAQPSDPGSPPGGEPVDGCWGLLPLDLAGARAVECLLVPVPLDHADPDGPSIRIATAVVRAAGEPAADPVLILGGGPGEKVVAALTPVAALAPDLLVDTTVADRDLVLIDQRGVGLSEPALECPEADALLAFDPLGPQPPIDLERLVRTQRRFAEGSADPFREALAICHQRLSAGTDLGAFTTAQNVEDLEHVRRAVVGDGAMALYGTSYGARLALRSMGAHPEAWSAVVLSSPIPGEANFIEEIAGNYADALERLAAACAADATGCGRAFPDLLDRLERAMQRLADPVQVRLPSPAGPVGLALDASTASNLLYQLLYQPARPVPAFIDALGAGRDAAALFSATSPGPRGDAGGALDLFGLRGDPDPTASLQSTGMQRSFLCAEEVAHADLDRLAADTAAAPAAVRAFAAAPFFGFLDPALCDVWPVPPVDPATFDPVESDVPTLVVTGGTDHITPPRYGEEVLAGLARGVLVEAPDMGHAPAIGLGPCGAALVGAFLADPDAELDASCAEDRPVRFDTVLPDTPAMNVLRVAGAERSATAARLSAWTFEPGVPTAFLATGRDFPDGLTAGAAGAMLDAPVLLTDVDRLPPATAAELARLRPGRIVVVGGTGAVGEGVRAAAAQAAGAQALRASGPDRFATAAALSRLVHPDGVARVYVATGQAFPDGLTASAAAGVERAPVLLTGRDVLPEATRAELDRLGPQEVVVVGGEAAVGPAVVTALEAAGLAVTRVAGSDRFATAAALADRAGPGTGWAFAVTGTAFPDALTAAPVAAGRGPLLLVARDHVPAPTAAAPARCPTPRRCSSAPPSPFRTAGSGGDRAVARRAGSAPHERGTLWRSVHPAGLSRARTPRPGPRTLAAQRRCAPDHPDVDPDLVDPAHLQEVEMSQGPASPMLRMSRAMSLSSGAPLERATDARRCSHPECTTTLSRYNPDATCARHGGWIAEAPPKRRRKGSRAE